MSKTMYRAHKWKPEPVAVEVVGETVWFITVRERSPGGGSYHDYRVSKSGHYDTWQECRDAAIENCKLRVDQAKTELQRLRSVLGNWESLKEPS